MKRTAYLFFAFIILSLSYCGKSDKAENSSTMKKSQMPDKNYLSQEWAIYIRGNPGAGTGKKITEEEAVKEFNKQMAEGIKFKKNKMYSKAIEMFEKALDYHADGKLYYNYGNTIWDTSLEKSIEAYKIALVVGDKKLYPLIYYNMACAYSLLKNAEDSFKSLKLALDNGYKNLAHIKRDSDIKYLLNYPDYKTKTGDLLFNLKKVDLSSSTISCGYGSISMVYRFCEKNQVDVHYQDGGCNAQGRGCTNAKLKGNYYITDKGLELKFNNPGPSLVFKREEISEMIREVSPNYYGKAVQILDKDLFCSLTKSKGQYTEDLEMKLNDLFGYCKQ